MQRGTGKGMVEANDNPEVVGKGNSEDLELKEHIETTKVFRVLLELQSNAKVIEEHCPGDEIDSDYSFAIVVQHVRVELNCLKDVAVKQLYKYIQSGYVTLSPPDENIELSQLLHAEDRYDKIKIYLNEPKMMEFLINDSVMLGNYIARLVGSIQKLEEAQNSYKNREEKIEQSCQEIKNLYSDANTQLQAWQKNRDDDKVAFEAMSQSLKTELKEVTKKAEENIGKATTDKIEEELMPSGKIGAAMQNMQKDILQYMGIFIAIFAIIGLNVGHAESWSTSDFFHMNLVITAAMATLLFLISVIMKGKSWRTFFMGILTAALWIAAAFVFCVLPYFKDEVIFFWETYYRCIRFLRI